MMKKHMILSFILLLAILTGPVAAAADPSLLENGLWEGEGIPSGWTVVSYQEDGFAVNAADGVAVLSSRQENDLRLAQRLAVEADRTYILSGEISAEQVSGGRGASLSIDNYSIDGTYLYSKSYT